MDFRPTSNAAAGAKIGNPSGETISRLTNEAAQETVEILMGRVAADFGGGRRHELFAD